MSLPSSSSAASSSSSWYYYEERLVITSGSQLGPGDAGAALLFEDGGPPRHRDNFDAGSKDDDDDIERQRMQRQRQRRRKQQQQNQQQFYIVRVESLLLQHSSAARRGSNDGRDNGIVGDVGDSSALCLDPPSSSSSSPPPPSSPFEVLRVFQNLLQRHGASRISIRVRHTAAASSSSSSMSRASPTQGLDDEDDDVTSSHSSDAASAWSSTPSGPAGVSVHVDFPLRGLGGDGDLRREERRRDHLMRRIVAELHARRILVAPVHGSGAGTRARGGASDDDASFRHTSRLPPRPFLVVPSGPVDVDPNNENATTVDSVVTYTYALPTEGSMWSSEGLASFLQLMPCGGDHENENENESAGWWGAASPEEWSHLLLGTAHDARRTATTTTTGGGPSMYSLAPRMPRSMWIEAKADLVASRSTPQPDSDGTCPSSRAPRSMRRRGGAVSLSAGIEYGVMVEGPDDDPLPSLRSLLPSAGSSGRSTLDVCPLADATRLVVINHPAAGVASPTTTTKIISFDKTAPLFEPISALLDNKDNDGATSVRELTNASAPRPRTAASWHLDYTVERVSGQANRGTLRASLHSYGGHKCPTIATVHYVLPRVVTPVWQSLHVQLFNASSSPVLDDKSSPPSMILQWKDLDWTDDVRTDDIDDHGTIRFSFRHALPPDSTLLVSIEYEPSFLNFEQFPPDPNRGFELPPVVAQLRTPASCDGAGEQAGAGGLPFTATLYSESPLLLAPVPDMSMPFNVISLTCTWYAFVIGSLIHLILRKGSERVKYALHPEKRPPPPLKRIKDKLQARWARAVTKFRTRGAANPPPPEKEPLQE